MDGKRLISPGYLAICDLPHVSELYTTAGLTNAGFHCLTAAYEAVRYDTLTRSCVSVCVDGYIILNSSRMSSVALVANFR